MFFGFDIGNTSTVMGLYEADSIVPSQILRYNTVKKSSASELLKTISLAMKKGPGLSPEEVHVSGMAFSSVVPEINEAYHNLALDYFGVTALGIGPRSHFSFPINYDNLYSLGIDRVVNTEAAFHDYGSGCIIVDLGTAITFDVLTHGGKFDGGIIAPGIGTSIETLSAKASKLPEVTFERPGSIVGRNTVDALKSGFYHGWISMIEGLVFRLEEHYGKTFRVVLTGGFARAVESGLHVGGELIVDPLLTMKGIRLVHNNSLEKK